MHQKGLLSVPPQPLWCQLVGGPATQETSPTGCNLTDAIVPLMAKEGFFPNIIYLHRTKHGSMDPSKCQIGDAHCLLPVAL